MDTPPIVSPREPPDEDPRQNGGQPAEGELNPFAPSSVDEELNARVGRVSLPPNYWAVLAVALLLFVAFTYFQPLLGVPAIAALIAAAIRVPLLQRRRWSPGGSSVLASPIPLLATSWVFSLMMGFASMIAFCIVCIPTGMVVFSVGNDSSTSMTVVFGVSAAVGLFAFIGMFVLSLRMPV